jgi:hypothetical protein
MIRPLRPLGIESIIGAVGYLDCPLVPSHKRWYPRVIIPEQIGFTEWFDSFVFERGEKPGVSPPVPPLKSIPGKPTNSDRLQWFGDECHVRVRWFWCGFGNASLPHEERSALSW